MTVLTPSNKNWSYLLNMRVFLFIDVTMRMIMSKNWRLCIYPCMIFQPMNKITRMDSTLEHLTSCFIPPDILQFSLTPLIFGMQLSGEALGFSSFDSLLHLANWTRTFFNGESVLLKCLTICFRSPIERSSNFYN